MKIDLIPKQFNWRYLVVRTLVNALVLTVTVLIVPKIRFVDPSVVTVLLLAASWGLLNAFVKPIVQFLTLPFIFATYGLVVGLINAILLWLLALLLPGLFSVDGILWALVAGLVIGLLSSFLESLLGLTIPVVPEEPAVLRQRLEVQATPTPSIFRRDESELAAQPAMGAEIRSAMEAGQGPALIDKVVAQAPAATTPPGEGLGPQSEEDSPGAKDEGREGPATPVEVDRSHDGLDTAEEDTTAVAEPPPEALQPAEPVDAQEADSAAAGGAG